MNWYQGYDGVEYPNSEAGVERRDAPGKPEKPDEREQWQVEEDNAFERMVEEFYSALRRVRATARVKRLSWQASGEEGGDPLAAFRRALVRLATEQEA